MSRETTAYAVADPTGELIVSTVRPSAAEARAAAVNVLKWRGKWPSMVAAGYRLVSVAVRVLDAEDPRDG